MSAKSQAPNILVLAVAEEVISLRLFKNLSRTGYGMPRCKAPEFAESWGEAEPILRPHSILIKAYLAMYTATTKYEGN
jgi:hypothetical protein